MKRLNLGVLLNAEYESSELIRLAGLAEELGYQRFWYVDVRLMRECYVGLASIAMRTQRIALATGVVDPYSRHPAITASALATLDELSGGRAIMGLGLGGAGFRELGLSKTLPIAALRECVAMVRGLWRGEEVTIAGKVVSLDRGTLQFTPPRSRIPIYIATQGEQVSRLAGEIAEGVLIANTVSEAGLDFYLGQIRAGAAKAGRPVEEVDIDLRWELCLSEDEDAAIDAMRRRLAQRMINGYPNWGFLKQLGVEAGPDFTAIAAKKDQGLLDAATAALPMDVVNASMVAGNPTRVARLIAPMLRPEVAGITIRPHACAGTGIADVMRSFVLDVMPLVERHRQQAATRDAKETPG